MRKRRCDCGKWATVAVTIRNMTAGQRSYKTKLILCPDCLREFKQHEEPLHQQTLDTYDK